MLLAPNMNIIGEQTLLFLVAVIFNSMTRVTHEKYARFVGGREILALFSLFEARRENI